MRNPAKEVRARSLHRIGFDQKALQAQKITSTSKNSNPGSPRAPVNSTGLFTGEPTHQDFHIECGFWYSGCTPVGSVYLNQCGTFTLLLLSSSVDLSELTSHASSHRGYYWACRSMSSFDSLFAFRSPIVWANLRQCL